jgi:hypothetical protein
MTTERTEALGERIATVLRERRRIGEERRRRENDYQPRNAQRTIARHIRLRGEPKGMVSRQVKELNAVYDAVISSNAADESVKAHGTEVLESQSPDSST